AKAVELVHHFDNNHFKLVNDNFEFPDLLGATYEYLIKYFADSAGKKGVDDPAEPFHEHSCLSGTSPC
ncbi:MAG TPA: hypothetical protein PLZ21_11535, partial [Armatimonadota bacterium]|nr:hypothetical protein [Armatimonadota bacterium]